MLRKLIAILTLFVIIFPMLGNVAKAAIGDSCSAQAQDCIYSLNGNDIPVLCSPTSYKCVQFEKNNQRISEPGQCPTGTYFVQGSADESGKFGTLLPNWCESCNTIREKNLPAIQTCTDWFAQHPELQSNIDTGAASTEQKQALDAAAKAKAEEDAKQAAAAQTGSAGVLAVQSVGSDECKDAADLNLKNISTFIWNSAFIKFELIGIGSVTDVITDLSPWGIDIGKIAEPLSDAMKFLNAQWWQVMTWAVIASFGNFIGAALVSAAIDLNSKLLIDNVLVQYGSKVVLGLVNFGFVIALIVIAITSILRIKGWELSKLLWKLVFAIVMVNFTILIAGQLINIGTKLTDAIYQAASPCPGKMASQFSAPVIYEKLSSATGLDKIDLLQDAKSTILPTGSPWDVVSILNPFIAIINPLNIGTSLIKGTNPAIESLTARWNGLVKTVQDLLSFTFLSIVCLLTATLISAAGSFLPCLRNFPPLPLCHINAPARRLPRHLDQLHS